MASETTNASDTGNLLGKGSFNHALCLLDPGGIVTGWNAAAERMKGYSATQIVGKHFSCFFTKEDQLADDPARTL